ncbi:hypothetical protein JAAARDRAFT_27798 [Jaapia argillacea MUCL 33604]|uniref:Cell division control protein 14 n=1 Tax=Jaapia argillacea MUCL 33604 TaxID=933084 RepID=A0A067QNG2_9AGAM|nr:hypothetical protein JAAARDRAFT_27798 [Jaapia argillacea MUCL 33604]
MGSLEGMQITIEDALDDLASTRTSTGRKTRALVTLEKLLASICIPGDEESLDQLEAFLILQDTFECNVPSRIVSWIISATLQLEQALATHERESEVITLSSLLAQALSIIQGISLNHKPSKRYLGRKYTLEILIDLLLVSRHVVPTPVTTQEGTSKPGLPLTSIILDTLLCILVDAPPALRAYEECHGVQVVVRILKRAGTPREVRMKCLEFLYFYLLDETTPTPSTTIPHDQDQEPPLVPTAPSTPTHTRRSQEWSTTSNDSTASSSSSSSNSSSASTSTAATSGAETPSQGPDPPKTPPLKHHQPIELGKFQPKSLLTLRKEVDYTPLSPKKPSSFPSSSSPFPPTSSSSPFPPSQIQLPKTPGKGKSRLGAVNSTGMGIGLGTPGTKSRHTSDASIGNLSALVGPPEPSPTKSQFGFVGGAGVRGVSREGSENEFQEGKGEEREKSGGGDGGRGGEGGEARREKTTEQKKELLGTMLGNVDALLEGVRKAGIWGLG